MIELFRWWNLVFLVPIGIALLLMLISAVGGFGDGDGDSGSTDASGGDSSIAGADADGEADGDDGDSESPLHTTLSFLGVGALPLSVLLQGAFLFFGVLGFIVSRTLSVETNPEGRIGIAIIGSLVMTLFLMAMAGRLARRFFPDENVPATANRDLVGRSGLVVFAVTAEGGTVQVRDASGTLHQVGAHLAAGAGEETLTAGTPVLLVRFEAERNTFLVEESPFSAIV